MADFGSMLSRLVHTAPDIYEIRIPCENISFGWTNCYVIIAEGEALVVDSGAPGSEQALILINELHNLGLSLDSLRVFLTHMHWDHSGLIDEVFPAGTVIYTNKDDFYYTREEQAFPAAEMMLTRTLAERVPELEARECARRARDCRYFDARKYDIRCVDDGDLIAVGKHEFKVLVTSGHTIGHQGLYYEPSGTLISGDQVLFIVSPCIDLSMYAHDTMGMYIDSLNRIKTMGIKGLLFAHGEPQKNFQARIDGLLAHHRKRMNNIVGIVQEIRASTHKDPSGYEIVRAIRWNVPYRWEENNLVRRGTIVMEGLAIIDHMVAAGVLAMDCKGNQNRYRSLC